MNDPRSSVRKTAAPGPSCAATGQFDARIAYENLARKYTALSDWIVRFMSSRANQPGWRNREVDQMTRILARIVGGVPVNNEHAECCLVGQTRPAGTMSWFCTGVLIHPRVVLTAGHCYGTRESRPNAVALRADHQDDLANAEILSLRRSIVHPTYRQTSQLSDLTVMVLRRDAKTPPVSVATTSEVNRATRALLVGFGNNDVYSTRGFGRKREVEVEIISIRRKTAGALDEDETRFGFESDLEFVAGGDGFDSCNGDSGGPAYILVNGRKRLAGLTSRAIRASTRPCGDGGIYTRVDKHMDFVTDSARQAGIRIE